MNDIDLVIAQFREWAQRQGLRLDADEPKVAFLDVPHQPVALPKGCQGVYAFPYEKIWLKVGKAGPNSNARWTS